MCIRDRYQGSNAAFVTNPDGKVIKKVAKTITNKLKYPCDFDLEFFIINLLL